MSERTARPRDRLLRHRSRRVRGVWILGVATLAVLTLLEAPRSGSDTLALAAQEPAARIAVGSKNFTEGAILGEIMTQLLRARTELDVVHRSGLGGTLIVFEALESGEIDLYPEYTGTGWSTILGRTDQIENRLEAFLTVQREFRERYAMAWLSPFGLNNTYTLAMAPERAEALDVRTISDLVERGADVRASFSLEFLNRTDGWLGLQSFYGLALGEVRGMEHALAYEAVRSDAVDLIDAYSTDGKLLRYGLRVLEDDRGFFPPYNGAPLVREDALERHPEIRSVLEELAFRLPNERIMALNDAVETGAATVEEVAAAFLQEEGLIEGAPAQLSATGNRDQGFVAFFFSRWRETLRLSLEHLQLTGIAVLLAVLLGVPLGIWITRHAWAERLGLGAAGAIQTVPSLALLAFMIAIPGLGLSARSAIVALFLYALLPILRNTFTGIEGVDPELVDAARGLGLTERQILTHVRLPIATRTILAGVRTATVISIGVATLAAFIGAGGLGEPIVTGLYLNDVRLIMAGALPATLLALLTDFLLGRLEKALTPRGLLA